jgi:SIR2-like domain/TIR domain
MIMGAASPANPASQLKIFISYRHEDTNGTAWALYWPLEARFGRENVFFDNGKLLAGDQWLDEINYALDSAGVLLILIGPKWWEAMSDRLRRPGKDYVKHEIERGLMRRPNLTVIPILVDETPVPDPDALPPSLKGIAACQIERLRHVQLREDVESLNDRLSEIAQRAGLTVPEPPPQANSPAVRPEPQSPITVQVVKELVIQPKVQPVPSNDGPRFVAQAPDDDHFDEVLTEARESGIVLFLGADVNAEDSQGIPDDEGLAHYISGKMRLQPECDDLAEAAQYARALRGEQRVFEMIREGLPSESQPGHVHEYLAGLPARLKQAGMERRHAMIVTPKYDAALERAFKGRDEPEPYDVVVYMGPGTDNPGKFVHVPWDSPPVMIDVPNEYQDLPIRKDGALDRTLIVRINGSIDDPDLNFSWKDNYVVTEDHYIQYLTGSPMASLVPVQIIDKLKSASYLFLGYSMADWRLRVFLKRLWPGEHLGTNTHWAIARAPTRFEDKLCFTAGVNLYQSSLTDYVDRFDSFLTAHTSPDLVP